MTSNQFGKAIYLNEQIEELQGDIDEIKRLEEKVRIISIKTPYRDKGIEISPFDRDKILTLLLESKTKELKRLQEEFESL